MNTLESYTEDQLRGLLELIVAGKSARQLFNKETFQHGVDYAFWEDQITTALAERHTPVRNRYDELPTSYLVTTQEIINP